MDEDIVSFDISMHYQTLTHIIQPLNHLLYNISRIRFLEHSRQIAGLLIDRKSFNEHLEISFGAILQKQVRRILRLQILNHFHRIFVIEHLKYFNFRQQGFLMSCKLSHCLTLLEVWHYFASQKLSILEVRGHTRLLILPFTARQIHFPKLTLSQQVKQQEATNLFAWSLSFNV